MAKKIILKDQNNIELIPVTRGELVLDSSGNQALHSTEFLATDSQPGLTLLHYVEVSKDSVLEISNEESPIIQLKSSSQKVYPVTISDAVIINSDNGSKSLNDVLHEIQIEVNNSKIVLDERPTEGNTTHSVSSDGIYQELKETVGNIQTLLQNL